MRSMQSEWKRSVLTTCRFLAAGLAIALLGAGNVFAQSGSNTAAGPGLLMSEPKRNALERNTTGIYNSAFGAAALNENTTGSYNTATGADALQGNRTGSFNTASGMQALQNARVTSFNVAIGYQTLQNTTGEKNTAIGYSALGGIHQTGSLNTAVGYNALLNDFVGSSNTATGWGALQKKGAGSNNTAIGVETLPNSFGNANTAFGRSALNNLKISFTSSGIVAVGYQAGTLFTSGINDIDIGSPGVDSESNTIRIGNGGTQTQTFIAGISGTAVQGADVVVDSNGQLGIVASSARFKRDIHSMGEASRRLMELRPVTFRYKEDRSGELQYGLVAEEVARVYPELVTYGADGKVQTVRYSELSGMLLNELQRQTGQVQKLADQLDAGRRELAALKADREREVARRTAFEARLSRLEGTTRASTAGGKALAAFDN
jgi:hypothetical protein